MRPLNVSYLVGRMQKRLGRPVSPEELLFRRHFGKTPHEISVTAVRVAIREKAAVMVGAMDLFTTAEDGLKATRRAIRRGVNLRRFDEGLREYEIERLFHDAVKRYRELREACRAAHRFFPDKIPEDPSNEGIFPCMPRLDTTMKQAMEVIKERDPDIAAS